MENLVRIFTINENGKEGYAVQSIIIQNGSAPLRIPSPFGSDSMFFYNLDSAVNAVKNAGFDYVLCKTQYEPANSAPEKTNINYGKIIDVFIKNLGNENLEIRTSSINALAKFGTAISEILIATLNENKNWLVQQSVVKCIEKIISKDSSSTPIFLDSLIKISETDNTMLKSSVLKALEKICDNKPE